MSINVIPIRKRIPSWTSSERLRKARREAGLTQTVMADRLDVKLSTYSAWETGRNQPDMLSLAPTLERITGIDRTWFIGWADENPRPDGPDGGSTLPGLDSNQEPIG